MTLADIAAVVGGEVYADDANAVVTAPAFRDSRAVEPGGLFVAIEGERVDGHDYAAQAVKDGAVAALVRHRVEAPCVVVADPVVALGQLAAHVRSALHDVVVVGITGSQGKTSTKDLIGQVLEAAGPTVATTGSLNNEIGTPLTVLRAGPSTRFLVVEMGARGRGHIHYLSSMAKPSIGTVLNVGVAHIGEFGSKADIAVAKGELVEDLPSSGVAVLNRDDPLVDAMRTRTAARVLTFGTAPDADVRVVDPYLDDDGHISFTLEVDGRRHHLDLALVGLHQASNAAAAAATALACGLSIETVVRALATAETRSRWRMELVETPAGVLVLNDAYNANPDSMRAALHTLADLGSRRPGSRTVAVLGEMLELGDAADDEHDALGRLAASLGIDVLVVVGESARTLHAGAVAMPGWGGEALWASDVDVASATVASVVRPGDIVLVKASRAVGLERVAEALVRTSP
ncbi:MAG TPA: UDP-N-acetylmuramoyl-tripeptide--D-alanyl-D-alanine ligase [Nocardioidaceae bacterium]|nr:UDP-N-acetylmuramoyl-tripeptide--D-alanyl-D-alanine ligase [Nocardioidaceae bacterium]